jgi:hypothetical protein
MLYQMFNKYSVFNIYSAVYLLWIFRQKGGEKLFEGR